MFNAGLPKMKVSKDFSLQSRPPKPQNSTGCVPRASWPRDGVGLVPRSPSRHLGPLQPQGSLPSLPHTATSRRIRPRSKGTPLSTQQDFLRFKTKHKTATKSPSSPEFISDLFRLLFSQSLRSCNIPHPSRGHLAPAVVALSQRKHFQAPVTVPGQM